MMDSSRASFVEWQFFSPSSAAESDRQQVHHPLDLSVP